MPALSSFFSPLKTAPARISACALARVSARPRSTSSTSRRFFSLAKARLRVLALASFARLCSAYEIVASHCLNQLAGARRDLASQGRDLRLPTAELTARAVDLQRCSVARGRRGRERRLRRRAARQPRAAGAARGRARLVRSRNPALQLVRAAAYRDRKWQ